MTDFFPLRKTPTRCSGEGEDDPYASSMCHSVLPDMETDYRNVHLAAEESETVLSHTQACPCLCYLPSDTDNQLVNVVSFKMYHKYAFLRFT